MAFESWGSVGRVVLTTVLAYASLVVMLRVSGKRTLSKLNAFDLVVTVALGSTLASVAVSRSVPLADGIAALATLIALQYVVAWAASRSARADQLSKSEPRVVFYGDAFLRHAMRAERVAEGEVLAAVRQAGAALEDVEAVVLESSGDLSVLRKAPGGPRTRVLGDARLDRTPQPGERGRAGADDPAH